MRQIEHVIGVSASGRGAVKTIVRGNVLFDWSPVAGRLAFSHDRALYDELKTINGRGSQLRSVTRFDGQSITGLSWNPSGNRFVVITAPRDGIVTASTLWVVDAVRGGKRSVYEGGRLGGVSWSPDGRWVIAVEFYRFRNPRLIFVGIDHDEQRDPVEGAFAGSWSPDGQHLAVVMVDMETTERTLQVLDTYGKKQRQVAEHVTGLPVWSHDGKSLAFLRYEGPEYHEVRVLYVVSPDGASRRRLKDIGPAEACLSWSPSNDRIAHLSSGQIGIIGKDGTNSVAIEGFCA